MGYFARRFRGGMVSIEEMIAALNAKHREGGRNNGESPLASMTVIELANLMLEHSGVAVYFNGEEFVIENVQTNSQA